MKRFLTTYLILLGTLSAFAQAFTLTGTVLNTSGEPYIGVSVMLKGTTIGTVTDLDGKFKLNILDLKKNNEVEFLYIGTKKQTYKVDGKTNNIKIVLEEDAMMLEESVVIGYSTMKKSDVTGSISVVRSEKSTAEASYTLADRVPGVAVSVIEDGIAAGTLTAGEVSDFAKWDQWADILNDDFASYLEKWIIRPLDRYTVQLTNMQGMPVTNANVVLQNKEGNPVWQTRTDNTGKAELWQNIFVLTEDDQKESMKIVVDYQGQSAEINNAKLFSEGINTIKIDTQCSARNGVDIFFIVDATGSMGDEIKYLQVELNDIIKKIQSQQTHLQLRVGSLVYRDEGDEYVTRKTSLDSDVDKTLNFLQEQRADGGGDFPEALDQALLESIYAESWNDDALARIAFLILDAPAHDKPEVKERIREQVRLAAEKGIRLVPVACSDIDKNTESLLRCIALATNGTYLFLTDDSGVGNAHIKPTTDKYEVEKLNDAMVRVVKQYTQMPDCKNDKWIKEQKKEAITDNFVPNPYDESPEEDVNKLSTKDIIKVYPNPCTDFLKVNVKRENVQDLYFVDMTGKSLFRFNPKKDDTVEINVQGLASGVYFVKVYYKGKWFADKVIVK